MSGPFSYTFYIPLSSGVVFPVTFEKATGDGSQVYSEIQITRQIESSLDPTISLGLGTTNCLKTVVVDQQGQINYLHLVLLNFNGEANGQTGGDIPPKGVLAVNYSFLNQTTLPTSPSDNSTVIIPPGQSSITLKGVINPALSSGAYFGAIGTTRVTHYADANTHYKYEVEYMLPSL